MSIDVSPSGDGKRGKGRGGAEKCGLLVIKSVQLALSIYFVYSLYQLGTYWILMASCIAVPIYGIYLVMRAPHQALDHPLAYIRYRALQERRGWTRVDGVVSATMSFILFCFSVILLFGYFHVNSAGTHFLVSAISAFLLSFLYMLNALINARQLQVAKIEFLHWGYDWPTLAGGNSTIPGLFATSESRRSPVENGADFLSIKSPMSLSGLHNRAQQLHRVAQDSDHYDTMEKPRGEEEADFTFQHSYDSAPSLDESGAPGSGRPMVRLSHATAEVLEVSIPVFEKGTIHYSPPQSHHASIASGAKWNNSDLARSVPYRRERQPYNRTAVNPTSTVSGRTDDRRQAEGVLEKSGNRGSTGVNNDLETISSTSSMEQVPRKPSSSYSTPATSHRQAETHHRTIGLFKPRLIDASASDTEHVAETDRALPIVLGGWRSEREFLPPGLGTTTRTEARTEL